MQFLNQKSKLDVNAWYCFMYEECSVKHMLLCATCQMWVHEDCAATSGNCFMSDFFTDK